MMKISVILFAAFASMAFLGCAGGNNSGSISTTESGNQSNTSNGKGDDEDETESEINEYLKKIDEFSCYT